MRPGDPQVLIVGAGPAGAALGLRLARLGIEVVILEAAARFPRDKPCGDCVNPGGLRELEALGVLGRLRRRVRPVSLHGWRVESPGGETLTGEFGEWEGRRQVGWAVRRRDLDAALLDEACHAGAGVRFGARVFDLLDGWPRVNGAVWRDGSAVRESRARLTIGADGLRSVVQRRLGLASRAPRLRKIALVGHLAGTNGTGGFGELRVRGRRVCGYAPLADGANVTLVMPQSDAVALGGDPAAFLRGALDAFPDVGGRVDRFGLEPGVQVTGPFDRPVRRVTAPGALLTGDAAGYYDPFTGQGIYQALRTAHHAAVAVAAALSDPEREAMAFRRYERRIRVEFEPKRAVQRLVDAVVNRPAAMSRFVSAISADEAELGRRLFRVTGDLDHPATLLHPAFLSRLALNLLQRI